MELYVQASKSFVGFQLETDFTVSGERIGIFGQSGGGKSTLAALIAGLHSPDKGEIILDGHCLFSSAKGISVPPEKRRIAVVFQQPCLFPHLDVRSNLLYGFKRCALKHRTIDFAVLIEVLKLGDLLERGVNNLSGGEKQRVALGRAVLANPRLLLMDEPLSALDEGLKFQIMPYLNSVSSEFAIPYLFISHSLVEMRLMAEQVLPVERGRVLPQTTPDELARARMGYSQVGYINLLRLTAPRPERGIYAYGWGDHELAVSAGSTEPAALFELSSKDIIIFKKHPEAISARNLLRCMVVKTFSSGNTVGVELACGTERLVAEVVAEAAQELGIVPGCQVFAAIKASSFRKLG
ncbi:molybdenum ABC transporter ATP-binding protein [Geotalea sp. SG265]|uniref:molybdenum ABC transporter ATP-binding protein n=1 Tax=Geotalea sp. SG265 TaxID=2922867 RepID=UPI001FAFD93E|nr:molybdenum ABC transporter ATP-binding protein [Geotalea sp. SG265]